MLSYTSSLQVCYDDGFKHGEKIFKTAYGLTVRLSHFLQYKKRCDKKDFQISNFPPRAQLQYSKLF